MAAESAAGIHIFVKLLNGSIIHIACFPSDTVYDVKQRISKLGESNFAIVEQLHLIFVDSELQNEHILSELGISTGDMLFLVVDLPNSVRYFTSMF
jgi:hypothetical protein